MNAQDGKFSRNLIAVAVGLCVHDLALAAPETPSLEEVVVTATRRAQSVQDVPYNISAIDGQQLKRAGITNMSELTKSIPGVSYVDRGVRSGAFSSGLAMRGISMEDGRLSLPLSTAPTVSTYVDETPLYANFYLSDVERVEVLRGPQGTLYGSGSLGGTLRFIHNKPSTEGLIVEASGDISQTENGDGINYTSGLMLNLPLGDTLAIRGNIGYTDNAGWIDAPALYVRDAGGVPELADPANPLSSPGLFQSQDGINSESTMNARVALRWMPTERFSAQLNYHKQKDESDGAPVQAVNLPGYGDYDSPSLLREPYDGDLELTSLELEYDLGFASVTTSLAHYESDQDFNTDATRLYLNFDFYAYSYGAMPRPAFTDYNENNDKSDVAEIRLTSQSEGPFDWVLGLYYMDQKTEVYNENYFPGYTDWADACADAGLFDCGLGTPLGTFNLIGLVPGQNPPSADAVGYQVSYDQNYLMDSRSEFTDKAAYGELTWNITDAWQITGGMRYFDQEFENTQLAGAIFVDAVTESQQSYETSDTLFKANTSYNLNENTMLYATWSEGFRRGGANALPTEIILFDEFGNGTVVETNPALFDYEPDRVTNTEIGIKGEIDGRIQYTAALYHIDWEDVQLDTSVTGYALPAVINAGDATSQGAELEINAFITDNLQAILGYAYVDAELTDPDATTLTEAGIDPASVEDRTLPWASKNTVSLTLQYYQQTSGAMSLLYGLRGSYRSDYNTQIDPAISTETDGYQIWSAYINLDHERWSVRLFADNVFDEEGIISAQSVSQFGTTRGELVSTPRTIGIGGTYRF